MICSIKILLNSFFPVLFIIAWAIPVVLILQGAGTTVESSVKRLSSQTGDLMRCQLQAEFYRRIHIGLSISNWTAINGPPRRGPLARKRYNDIIVRHLLETPRSGWSYTFIRFADGSVGWMKYSARGVMHAQLCASKTGIFTANTTSAERDVFYDCDLEAINVTSGMLLGPADSLRNMTTPTFARSYAYGPVWNPGVRALNNTNVVPTNRSVMYANQLFVRQIDPFGLVLSFFNMGVDHREPWKVLAGMNNGLPTSVFIPVLRSLLPKARDSRAFVLEPSGRVILSTHSFSVEFRNYTEGARIDDGCYLSADRLTLACQYNISDYSEYAFVRLFTEAAGMRSTRSDAFRGSLSVLTITNPHTGVKFVGSRTAMHLFNYVFTLLVFIPLDFYMEDIEKATATVIVVCCVVILVGAAATYFLLRIISGRIEDLAEQMYKDPFAKTWGVGGGNNNSGNSSGAGGGDTAGQDDGNDAMNKNNPNSQRPTLIGMKLDRLRAQREKKDREEERQRSAVLREEGQRKNGLNSSYSTDDGGAKDPEREKGEADPTTAATGSGAVSLSRGSSFRIFSSLFGSSCGTCALEELAHLEDEFASMREIIEQLRSFMPTDVINAKRSSTRLQHNKFSADSTSTLLTPSEGDNFLTRGGFLTTSLTTARESNSSIGEPAPALFVNSEEFGDKNDNFDAKFHTASFDSNKNNINNNCYTASSSSSSSTSPSVQQQQILVAPSIPIVSVDDRGANTEFQQQNRIINRATAANIMTTATATNSTSISSPPPTQKDDNIVVEKQSPNHVLLLRSSGSLDLETDNQINKKEKQPSSSQRELLHRSPFTSIDGNQKDDVSDDLHDQSTSSLVSGQQAALAAPTTSASTRQQHQQDHSRPDEGSSTNVQSPFASPGSGAVMGNAVHRNDDREVSSSVTTMEAVNDNTKKKKKQVKFSWGVEDGSTADGPRKENPSHDLGSFRVLSSPTPVTKGNEENERGQETEGISEASTSHELEDDIVISESFGQVDEAAKAADAARRRKASTETHRCLFAVISVVGTYESARDAWDYEDVCRFAPHPLEIADDSEGVRRAPTPGSFMREVPASGGDDDDDDDDDQQEVSSPSPPPSSTNNKRDGRLHPQKLLDRSRLIAQVVNSDVIESSGAHLIEYRNDTFYVVLRLSKREAQSRAAYRFVCKLVEAAQKIADSNLQNAYNLAEGQRKKSIALVAGLSVGDARFLFLPAIAGEVVARPITVISTCVKEAADVERRMRYLAAGSSPFRPLAHAIGYLVHGRTHETLAVTSFTSKMFNPPLCFHRVRTARPDLTASSGLDDGASQQNGNNNNNGRNSNVVSHLNRSCRALTVFPNQLPIVARISGLDQIGTIRAGTLMGEQRTMKSVMRMAGPSMFAPE